MKAFSAVCRCPARPGALIGAGGAGVAVAHAALKLGIGRLDIFDQDVDRSARLAHDLNTRFGEGRAMPAKTPAAVLGNADGLIHATPVGMPAHPGIPVDPDLIMSRHWVADIVYMPLITRLIETAAGRVVRHCRAAAWRFSRLSVHSGYSAGVSRMRSG